MSLTARIAALLIVLGLMGAGVWRIQVKADAAGYQRAQQEYQAAAELQREGNRGRARQAEEKQVVQTVYRDRFITKTITEVRHAAAPLAACLVPAAAISLLNDVAECARADRPASCGAGNGVRNP
ncbi:MAG: hypothetical protein J0H69_16885 [Burkholderiales bacterium]|nr:hypothetical protein [Burkholderiales bacterium]